MNVGNSCQDWLIVKQNGVKIIWSSNSDEIVPPVLCLILFEVSSLVS